MSGKANDLLSYLNAQSSPKGGHLKAPAPSSLRVKHPVAFGGGASKGGGRFYQPKAVKPIAPQKKSGGGFGGFLHSVGGAFTGAAHDAAKYSDQASHDIAAMPAGLVKVGQAVSHDSAHISASLNHKLGL